MSSMVPGSERVGMRSRKLSNVGRLLDGWPKIYYLELLHDLDGTLSHRSLAPTKPHCARVVGYGPFSLCLIHKEALCPSSEDINRLMIMAPEMGCDKTAIGLQLATSAVFLIAKSLW
jgi:hypothetical protein